MTAHSDDRDHSFPTHCDHQFLDRDQCGADARGRRWMVLLMSVLARLVKHGLVLQVGDRQRRFRLTSLDLAR